MGGAVGHLSRFRGQVGGVMVHVGGVRGQVCEVRGQVCEFGRGSRSEVLVCVVAVPVSSRIPEAFSKGIAVNL